MEVRQIPSSDRGLFFHRFQGPQGFEDAIHFLRVRVPEKSENPEEPLELPKAPQSDPDVAISTIYIYV